jgi:hypothetical protein
MAILFGFDNYRYDFRIRELEQAFRQRQLRTVAIVAVLSISLTTGIGIGLLWLTGALAVPSEPRSTAVAVAAPSAERLSEPGTEKLYGCFAAAKCSALFQNFETRPISLEPSVAGGGWIETDTRPNGDDRDSAMANKADVPVTERAAHPPASQASEIVAPPPTVAAGGATDETRQFIQRARGFLVQGDIKTARLFLERAADLGDSSATFALAETYDPIILRLWPARSLLADRDRARVLYEEALASGVAEAKQRINRLAATSSTMR